MSAVSEYQRAEQAEFTELVRQHTGLVKSVAYHLLARLPNEVVDVNDLIQSGMVGLLEAAKAYTPDRSVEFGAFAVIRIRGAMLDELRRGDWTPRSVHRQARQVVAAIRAIEHRTGKAAQKREILQEMGITAEAYDRVLSDAASAQIVTMPPEDADLLPSAHQGPDTLTEKALTEAELAAAIESLPEREKTVIGLYYQDELNLREIGEVLGVGVSRVSQIHAQALLRLRARMAGPGEGDR